MPVLLALGDAPVVSTVWKVHPVDLAIIVVYMVGIVALGCWAGIRRRRGAEGSDYFLAGRSLRWPMIGLALFATNISTIHLVSFAQSGYTSGLLFGNYEWMAGYTLVILSLFFAPFYIRANVATLPDFLEKRYSRGSRDLLAVLSIYSAIVVHIGFSLYTGAVVLEGSLLRAFTDNPEQYRLLTLVAIAGATALYTIIGGLMAVVLTESIQTVVLLFGAICITILGLIALGTPEGETVTGLASLGYVADGWRQLKANVHPNNMGLLRPDCDPTALSWYAVFLGYPIAGIWYWCTDQTIVQRVLAAKDERNARLGPLFAGFIKILPIYIFVLPGLICLALINAGGIAPLPTDALGQAQTDETYSHLITHILPTGAHGIVLAALLAALMSTVSGALNSIATLVSYDIFRRWAPDMSDHKLVIIGRITTFVAMIVAIVWTFAISALGKTIFQAMVDSMPVVAPPTAVVFVWGVFWRRASAKAALITLISGGLMGGVVTTLILLKMDKIGDYQINSLLALFLLAVVESVILVVCSYIFPHRHTKESEQLVWKHPLEALKGKFQGVSDYRVWAGVLVAIMVFLYWWFAGSGQYYPVEGTVRLADGSPVVGAELTFECDDPALNFTALTDAKGKYFYGTTARAGGAPAGTRYRVKIVPKLNLVVRGAKAPSGQGSAPASEPVDEVLALVPIGAEIREEIGRLLRDENVTIVTATDIPARYTEFETSGLECKIRSVRTFATRKHVYDFQLLKPAIRVAHTVGIKPDQIERCRQLHAHVPAGVLGEIKNGNFRNDSIYLRKFPDGNHYLCRYFEYLGDNLEQDLQAVAGGAAMQDWQRDILLLQVPFDDVQPGDRWTAMEPVFYYGGPDYDRSTAKRYASVIGLKAESIPKYKRLHANTWPSVLAALETANIRNYSIFLRQFPDKKHYLFAYFEYAGEDFEADMAGIAEDEEVKRWWEETDPTQRPFEDRGEGNWWASMEELFHQE